MICKITKDETLGGRWYEVHTTGEITEEIVVTTQQITGVDVFTKKKRYSAALLVGELFDCDKVVEAVKEHLE